MKIIFINIMMLTLLNSCLQQGEESDDSSSGQEDVTISLLSINPPSKTLSLNESFQFQGVGGNPPYTYAIEQGLGSIASDGTYTAPGTPGTATVKVTDDAGSSAYGVVSIGAALAISPTTRVMGVGETETFTGVGGIAPYTFAVTSGSGTINSSTGVYTAPGSSGTDTVEIRDAANSTAYATVSITNVLAISPTTATVEDLSVTPFTASGGTPPYTFTVLGNGSVDGSGNYTAPATADTAIVQLCDNSGDPSNCKTANITIALGPSVSATATSVVAGGSVTISSSEGTAPFSYSIVSGGGSVVAGTGVFTAPAQADTTVIRCTDNNGFTNDITITTFNLTKVSAEENRTCILQLNSDNTTSTTKCFGSRRDGRLAQAQSYLGDAAGEMGDNLAALNFGTGVTPVAVYSSRDWHRCVLFSDNRMKCWGYAGNGRLGGNFTDAGFETRTMGDYLKFTQLGTGVTVSTNPTNTDKITLGGLHTCAIVNDGADKLKCWGRNNQGQLGLGHTADRCTGNGNCYDNLPFVNLGAGVPAEIVAGYEHTCVRLTTNDVKCWGRNNYGQLGYDDTASRGHDGATTPDLIANVDLGVGRTAKMLSAGDYFTCALLDNDEVKCWGRANNGQLGYENTTQQGDDPGEMAALGYVSLSSTKTPAQIYSSGIHSCVIFTDQTMKCWGYNGFGNLGQGNTTQRGDGASEMGDNLALTDLNGSSVSKLALSYRTTCALTTTGQVKCWGDNIYGQAGIEDTTGNNNRIGNGAGEMGAALAAIDLGTGRTATDIAVNQYGACAVLDNNTVKCWGRDYYGESGLEFMGLGDATGETLAATNTIDFGVSTYAQDVWGGRHHNCALMMDNSLKCWGNGGQGRLGLENTANLGETLAELGAAWNATDVGTGLTVTKMDGGDNHSCALLSDNTVKCWGDGANGRRGSGDQADRGDGASEMGDNLATVNLGAGRTATDVCAHYAHACALLDNGTVKCWGYNNRGQLGQGDTTQRGHDGTTTPDLFGAIDLGTGRTAQKITCGYNHNCALLDNDTVKCWGRGNYGQIGQETNTNLGDAGGEMGDALPAVNLGTGRTALDVKAGIWHTCALLDNYKVKCWGLNSSGQLGIGTSASMGDGAGEMGDALDYADLGTNYKALSISVGGYHSCAVLDNNDVKCWGNNRYGQAVQEHGYNIGLDGLSLGDNLPAID